MKIVFTFFSDIDRPKKITFYSSYYIIEYAKKVLIGLTEMLFSLSIKNMDLTC